MSKIITFFDIRPPQCRLPRQSAWLNTLFPNWRCPQICPRPQLAATERLWTSTDVKKNAWSRFEGDFPRLSHRSGRSWTSLNAFGWWAV